MIRVMRLLSRSRVRMLAVGGGGGGRGGGNGSTVNFNYRRCSSASSSVPPLSSESIKEGVYNRKSSTTIADDDEADVADFVNEVGLSFQDEPERFDVFMTVLLDFRVGRIDLSVLKEVMMKLLKGHNNLIWKFNNLLPPGEIPLPLDDDGLPFKYDSTAFRDYQE